MLLCQHFLTFMQGDFSFCCNDVKMQCRKANIHDIVFLLCEVQLNLFFFSASNHVHGTGGDS